MKKIIMTEQELQILENMLSRIEQCETTMKLLLNANKELLRGNKALTESLDSLRSEYECYSDNCIYEIFDPRFDKQKLFYPKICSPEETLDMLLKNEKSLCRFGDGEFACINGSLRAHFTSKYYYTLAERLKEVLESNRDDVMIAIADNYGYLSCYSPQTRREIRSYMSKQVRMEQEALLDSEKRYYNAYVTRPFTFLFNNLEGMFSYIGKFKQLWHARNVIVVEGKNTGFGVGNNLLDNCAEVKRIIAPAVDAFERYDEILKEAMAQNNSDLYLIALGPVATVLAYDLAVEGRRAIDIGHLDIEYEWMKRGYRTIIPGKYVNEVVGGTDPEPIEDSEYRKQIVAEIC